jgi:hypothetical protein
MGHLSLLQRCRLLRFECDVSISPPTLRKYYHSNGIRFTKALYYRRKKVEREQEIEARKKDFARQLALFKM